MFVLYLDFLAEIEVADFHAAVRDGNFLRGCLVYSTLLTPSYYSIPSSTVF